MTKKQLLASALAALMISGSAGAVSAKTYDDVAKDSRGAEQISILSDLGVIKGTSENEFSPDTPVTREQMAALLFRLMLGRDDAGRENTTAFRDLYEPYYNGAISWANAAGYIRGTAADRFNPLGGITKQDAMTMLVRALGQENDSMNAGYPWSYIQQAVRLGLDRGLEDVGYGSTLTRAEVAVILSNALSAELLLTKTAPNGAKIEEATSVIEEVFGCEMTDAVLTATNRYALEGEPVVKTGFAAFRTADGRTFTADCAEIAKDADARLGETFRLILKSENGIPKVLSAVSVTEREEFDGLTVDKKTVKIGGGRYVLVSEYSDALSTNDNELKLFAFDGDAVLEQIETAEELEPLTGLCRVTLMRTGDAEKIAVLMPFEAGRLEIGEDGRVNLAENRKDVEVKNPKDAVTGDYVLYYYNKNTDSLVIADILGIETGAVKRLTSSTAKIGDGTYELGCEKAGIRAEDLRAKLTLGKNAVVAVAGDRILSVIEGTVTASRGRYLVALTDAYRIYEDGAFRYVMTAFLDGEERNLYVKDDGAERGRVYRWTETDGICSLTAAEAKDGVLLSGRRAFADAGDIALIVQSAAGSTVKADGRNTFVLKAGDGEVLSTEAGRREVKFIVDGNSEIAVCQNGRWTMKRGANLGDMEIADGAQITAVFADEIGTVETLRYLCVTNGSAGAYDPEAASVRILAVNGLVYENGRTWTEYTVYRFADNRTDTVLGASAELEIGRDYRLDAEGHATAAEAAVTGEGTLTGYTSGTVSVDGRTYAVAKDMKAVRLTKDHKAEDVKIAGLYLTNVEFVAEDGEVKLLIEGADPVFAAERTEAGIALVPDFDLGDLGGVQVQLKGLSRDGEALDTDGMKAAVEEGRIVVTLPQDALLAAGEYTVTFTVNSKAFSAVLTLEAAENAENAESGEGEGEN